MIFTMGSSALAGRSTLDDAGANQAAPTLLKASIIVRANRLKRYWKAPEMDDYWSWMPEMSFTVLGPINTGSAFFIDFTNEAGAAWYTVECSTEAIDATRWQTIVTPAITTHIDKRTTLGTGTFGFTIRMKSELSGTNQTVFSGKFKVTKFHIGGPSGKSHWRRRWPVGSQRLEDGCVLWQSVGRLCCSLSAGSAKE